MASRPVEFYKLSENIWKAQFDTVVESHRGG
jgi:hypothetical protein